MGNAASIPENVLKSGAQLTTDNQVTYKEVEQYVESVTKQLQQVLLRSSRGLFKDTEQKVEVTDVQNVIVESIRNYLPAAVQVKVSRAVSLGDVLGKFLILKDEPRVKEQSELLGPIEQNIRNYYADGGNDTPDTTDLAERVEKLHEAYAEALQRRTTKKGRIKEWLHVFREGNDGFEKVYDGVWEECIFKREQPGVKKYTASVAKIRGTLAKDAGKPQQLHSDAVPLYLEAAQVKPAFDRVVRVEIQKKYAHLSGGKELKIQICPTLKHVTRVIEKARLKGRNSAACVKDIVRAMVTVDSMDEVAIVMDVLCVLHEEGQIEVVRIKERFLEAPSAGGWRDVMINFRVVSGGNKHICELQVVHTSMLNARKGLPGHAYYVVVRNAMEMMNYCPEGAPKMYSVDMAGLLPFVPGDMSQVKHEGWLREDVPLGEWAGVTTNAEQQVTGLDVKSLDNQITDADLKQFAQGCPNLTKIYLAGCSKITNNTLKYLANDCHNLKYIDLEGVQSITDDGLAHLAQGCPNLAFIQLRECSKITDAGVKHLGEGCHNLTTVILHNCRDVTDACLGYLGRGCPKLKKINLGNCDLITDAGLEHLAQGCQNLRNIYVGGCDNITLAGIKNLKRGCPKMKVLFK